MPGAIPELACSSATLLHGQNFSVGDLDKFIPSNARFGLFFSVLGRWRRVESPATPNNSKQAGIWSVSSLGIQLAKYPRIDRPKNYYTSFQVARDFVMADYGFVEGDLD